MVVFVDEFIRREIGVEMQLWKSGRTVCVEWFTRVEKKGERKKVGVSRRNMVDKTGKSSYRWICF